MATYFPNSSNQRDVVPTLYVREPTTTYSEALPVHPTNMMMYMNYSSSSGSYSDNLNGSSQQNNQNCVDLPTEMNNSQQGILTNLGVSHSQDQGYNVWRDGRNEMLFMHPTTAPMTIQSIGGGTDNLVQNSVNDDSQMGLRSQLGILGSGQHNLQGQGLSLSLSTHIPSAIPVSSFQFGHPNLGMSSFLASHHQTMSGEGGSGTSSCRADDSPQNKQSRNAEYFQPGFTLSNHDVIKRETLNNFHASFEPKQMHSNPSQYGLSGFVSSVPNSKYLKATQQLLEEVVNVQKAMKKHETGSKDPRDTDGGSKEGAAMVPSENQEMSTNSAPELSPTERQDLHNKLTKLLSMLDEVDRRYRQYYHQMQIVVSSFDVVAGCGAAKPYTALALETISRHFRCLRDAISGQIKTTRRGLGEQDTTGNSKVGGISRLRFVDQQLRQQKAFQQLGIMQQHAWRPQRGLPETSVSVLRAWLFEHFLHPYPKDSDKIMLARQTGLTRSQVSNWFINARVRLWKPMVEEMYKEEFGDNEMDSISSSENIPEAIKENNMTTKKVSEDRMEELKQSSNPAPTERYHPTQLHEPKCNQISDIDMSGSMAGTSYMTGPHGDEDVDYTGMKLRGDQRPNEDDSSLLQDDGRFIPADAAYQMAELGRFGSGDGVSLTLGLQHCEGGGLAMAGGTHNNFITMRGDEMYTAAPSLGAETADYDCIDPGNRRHRFGSSHMLHDFVA